jgi:hypothetical protein
LIAVIIAIIGLSVLAIVAFLGRNVGTFTVSLNNSDIRLSLSESRSFQDSTSFLRINDVKKFQEYTYQSLPSDQQLDNEENSYLYGANYDENNKIQSMNFFKYTFYVKNVSNVSASYDMNFEITDNHAARDGRYLDDTLRVMVYENNDDELSSSHNKTVYAKKAAIANRTAEGDKVFNEYISTNYSQADEDHPCYGLAETFESETKIASLKVKNFNKDEVKRYTVVTWLEGYDPQSNGNAPEGAKIKIGVKINAYENE